MYLEFYGLREAPFDLAPNPRYLYFSPRHREAYNHLAYGIREGKGFVQLTGEVGCGKTTLCRALLHEIGDQFATALILNPWLGPEDLLPAVAAEFGLTANGHTPVETLTQLNSFLIQQFHEGRSAILLIDEAQDLTPEQLEQVRLLSNLETDERKLLQIVLMGQPELRQRLNDHQLRQLRQRITVRFHIDPLRQDELYPYIQHRLTVAGSHRSPEFSTLALWRIHLYARGIPRLINALCDKCLLAGFVEGRHRVGFATACRAARELEGKITV